MAPMKFEDNIKEKLAGRTMEPSAEAWKRVAKQLEEKRPKIKIGRWVAIAAGFIGILIIAGGLFFSPVQEDANPVVDVTTKVETKSQSIPQNEIVLETSENLPKTTENQVEKLPNLSQKRLKKSENQTISEEKIVVPPTAKEQVAAVEVLPNESQDFDPSLKQSIDQEVEYLLAQVDSIGKNNTVVTDAQVDALLVQAQEKIVKNRVFEAQTESLSATALLQEVEGELDRSFRDKIFEALKEGFIKAREAVVSRND